MGTITISDHAMLRHHVSKMRDVRCGREEFRTHATAIGAIIASEVSKDLPLREIKIQTPLEETVGYEIASKHAAIIPVLRAGLSIFPGFEIVVDGAIRAFLDADRNEKTLVANITSGKLPASMKLPERRIYILESMLATGNTAIAVVDEIKAHGGIGENITFAAIIAAPEGIDALSAAHPDINIYVGEKDRCLNDQGYILPGLGDAGDRLCGTL